MIILNLTIDRLAHQVNLCLVIDASSTCQPPTCKSVMEKHHWGIPSPNTCVETWEKSRYSSWKDATGKKKSQIFASGLCEETIPKALLVNLV